MSIRHTVRLRRSVAMAVAAAPLPTTAVAARQCAATGRRRLVGLGSGLSSPRRR